jgi:IrrE N-terminal-like domain
VFSPKLRHRWNVLNPGAQRVILERASMTLSDVERLLSDERVFMTTPVDDRRRLAALLGFKEPDHWLVRSYGGTQPTSPVEVRDPEKDAMQLLANFRHGSRPPIDVEALAEAMGAGIAIEPIRGDGRLERRAGRPIVLVSSNASAVRRRFTIAHELGHLWLQDHIPANDRFTRSEEERFCNQFAAALLMPQVWVASAASGRNPDLRSLTLLALEARTSKAAMLVRLSHLQGWRLSLIRFRWDEGSWKLHAATSVPARLQGVTSAPHTAAVLREARRHAGTVRLALPLTTSGKGANSYRAEIQVNSKDAVALVDFSKLCDGPAAYCSKDRAWVRVQEPKTALADGTPATVGACPHCKTRLFKLGS